MTTYPLNYLWKDLKIDVLSALYLQVLVRLQDKLANDFSYCLSHHLTNKNPQTLLMEPREECLQSSLPEACSPEDFLPRRLHEQTCCLFSMLGCCSSLVRGPHHESRVLGSCWRPEVEEAAEALQNSTKTHRTFKM